LKWGGHAAAAGMTLDLDDLPAFRQAFLAESERRRAMTELGSDLAIDLEIPAETDPRRLSHDEVLGLERLGPFGRGNPRPALLLRNARISSPPRAIGRDGGHLAMNLRLGETESRAAFFEARWWNAAARAPSLAVGKRCDLVVSPRIDQYLGERKVLLEILDVAPG